jgi:hypothetical protein
MEEGNKVFILSDKERTIISGYAIKIGLLRQALNDILDVSLSSRGLEPGKCEVNLDNMTIVVKE